MSDAERYEKAKTAVFWHVNDCQIPSGLNALLVSQNIRSALKNNSFHGEISIFAYGSEEPILFGLDESSDAIVLKHIPARDKDGREREVVDYRGTTSIYEIENESPAIVINPTTPGDKYVDKYGAFIRGFFSWALDNYPPANMILILGDVGKHKWRLIGAFNHLRDAGYNVAFVQPQKQASMDLIRIGRRNWPWERLSLGEGPIPIPRPKPKSESFLGSRRLHLVGVGALVCIVIVVSSRFRSF